MLVTGPPREIVDGLTMLGTDEYPIYLFRDGDQAVIFEGGTGAMGPLLKEQVTDLDLDPAMVKQAIITHAHPDHVMAVPMFRELFPEVSVAASLVWCQDARIREGRFLFLPGRRSFDGRHAASRQDHRSA